MKNYKSIVCCALFFIAIYSSCFSNERFKKIDSITKTLYNKQQGNSNKDILKGREILPKMINKELSSIFTVSKKKEETELNRSGCEILGDLLSEKQIEDIHAFLDKELVYRGHTIRDSTHLTESPIRVSSFKGPAACYNPNSIANSPHLMEIATHPEILEKIESYFGCPPTLYDFNILWIFGDYGSHGTQRYHRDYDDFYQVTLFVYLTDVFYEADGAHKYMLNTHFGKESGEELLIFGKAGTAFLTDSFGKHRGTTPSKGGKRLMFWARYGLGKNRVYRAKYSFKDLNTWQLNKKTFQERFKPTSEREEYIFRLFL